MEREEILKRAGRKAEPWSSFLGNKVFDGHDVAMMLALLKIAQICAGEESAVSYADLAGYAACAGEIATEKPAPFKPEL